MTEFLAEVYVSRTGCAATHEAWQRLVRAAAELTAEGQSVRPVRSIFVPEDETCFLLFEAGTAEAVHETARRAAVTCERVVEAAGSEPINTKELQ